MTAPASFGTVEEAERALAALTRRIDRAKGKLEGLYDERRVIFRFLLASGQSQASIARRIGATPMVVALALKGNGNGARAEQSA